MSEPSSPPQPRPPRLFAVTTAVHPSGKFVIGVIAKRTYLVRAGRCLVADEQMPLVEAPVTDPDTDLLLHDTDLVLHRTKADIVVGGKARAFGRATFQVGVRIGEFNRVASIFGDRRCFRDFAGQLRFSEPTVREEIDLGWTDTYGGVDLAALAKRGDPLEPYFESQSVAYRPRFGSYAYPRNRAGKGYLLEPTTEALEACQLPNVEDPRRPLTPAALAIHDPLWWPAAPLPVSFGWLPYHSFPRMAMLGLTPRFDHERFPDGAFPEVEADIIQRSAIAKEVGHGDRLDIAVAQQSAIGMRAHAILPCAPVVLDNIHPRISSWSFILPLEVPRMAVEVPRSGTFEPTPSIRMVLLDPDTDRISLVWVGEHVEATPLGPAAGANLRFHARWPSA